MVLPFVEVTHLPGSSSFYSAILQPLGFRFLGEEKKRLRPAPTTDCLSEVISLGTVTYGVPQHGYTTETDDGPMLQLREPAHASDPIRQSLLLFSAPSRDAVTDFHACALRSYPKLAKNQAVRLGHQGGVSKSTICDLSGNVIEVVYPAPAGHPPVRGATGRLLEWSYDISSSQVTSRSSTLYSSSNAPSPLRRSFTASAYEPSVSSKASTATYDTPPPSSKSNEYSTASIFGAVLGVAAGAAAAAALTYNYVNRDKERKPEMNPEPPALSRRSTYPEKLPSNTQDQPVDRKSQYNDQKDQEEDRKSQVEDRKSAYGDGPPRKLDEYPPHKLNNYPGHRLNEYEAGKAHGFPLRKTDTFKSPRREDFPSDKVDDYSSRRSSYAGPKLSDFPPVKTDDPAQSPRKLFSARDNPSRRTSYHGESIGAGEKDDYPYEITHRPRYNLAECNQEDRTGGVAKRIAKSITSVTSSRGRAIDESHDSHNRRSSRHASRTRSSRSRSAAPVSRAPSVREYNEEPPARSHSRAPSRAPSQAPGRAPTKAPSRAPSERARSRTRSEAHSNRLRAPRAPSAAPSAAETWEIFDVDQKSHAGSHHTGAPKSTYSRARSHRSRRDADRESHVSTRSHRTSGSRRHAPAPHEESDYKLAGRDQPDSHSGRRSSYMVPGDVPLPMSIEGENPYEVPPSYHSARDIPLPLSNVGSSQAEWDDDVISLAPSDSISCVGSRSSRYSSRRR